jgi:hypothetical protein
MSLSFLETGIYGLLVGRIPGRTPWSARVPLDPLSRQRNQARATDKPTRRRCGPGGQRHIAPSFGKLSDIGMTSCPTPFAIITNRTCA